MWRQLVSDFEIEFGDHGESRLVVVADIARQRQKSARHGGAANGGRAVDLGIAEVRSDRDAGPPFQDPGAILRTRT